MDIQQKNQMKQHKENLEKQYEQQQRLAPVKLQNEYNKQNLETQYKRNLEIFDKQAELTREMQEKQTKLLKNLSWRTVIAILAVIVGAVLGMYLERSGLKQPPQSPPKQVITTTEKQNNSALPSPGERETIKATKPLAQGESSSKNSLKKP